MSNSSLLDGMARCVGSAIGYSVVAVVETAKAAYAAIRTKEHRMVITHTGDNNYTVEVDNDHPIVCGCCTAKRMAMEASGAAMPYEPTWDAVKKIAEDEGVLEELRMDGTMVGHMVLSY